MKSAQMICGLVLMLLAPIIGGPIIPGPFGFLGFALGLALVLRSSRWARKRYVLFKRRHPKWAHWTELGLRRRRRGAGAEEAQQGAAGAKPRLPDMRPRDVSPRFD